MSYFTWKEISKHNSPEDCWVVIDGSVYDVTGWVGSHPGGDILTSLSGEDISALFHSYHVKDITSRLEACKIGRVAKFRSVYDDINDSFLKTLKARVSDYFTDKEINYRETPKNKICIILTAILFFTSWSLTYLYYHSLPLTAVLMGLCTCSLIGSFGHEIIHANLFAHTGKKKTLYKLLNDILWGVFIPFMPERFFQYEHLKHHMYPMNPEYDYDVFALRHLIRLSPQQEIKKYHSMQHIYAPFVYGIYLFVQILGGYTSSFFSSRNLLKDKGVFRSVIISSFTAFAIHVAIPMYLTGIWWMLLCNAVYFFTWQSMIYVTSGVPHMTGVVNNANANASGSWAYYVCSSTCNIKCGNKFVDWVTGGLNYHLVHHLLPAIPREYFPDISHIVESTCQEFGYPYRMYTSFFSYYKDHFEFLYHLGHTSTAYQVAE